MMFFIENFVGGILTGSVYSLIAVAFVLIFKSCKILNLAQGGFVLLGAYFSYSFMAQLHLPVLPSMVLTLAVCSFVVLLLERFPLRPLIGQPILSIIMATIGIEMLITGLCILIWGVRGWREYPQIFELTPLNLAGLNLSRQHLMAFVVTVILLIFSGLFFKKTKTGLLMRATAEGHMVAQSMGIKVNKIFAFSWMGSAIISAIAGIFLGSMVNVNVNLSEIALKALPGAIFGGLESIPGAFIGGILIGLLESLSQAYIGHDIGPITPYLVMMVILIYRPQGLFGLEIIERV